MNERRVEPGPERIGVTPDRQSDHYIEAHTSLVERVVRTLKEGDAFAVLDRYGDLGTLPDCPEGLFFRDTRYLSRYELHFNGRRPLLLGSVIQDDNAALTVNLANPDIQPLGEGGMPRDIIALERTKFLWQGACYERIGLRNYDSRRRRFIIELKFDADFRDLFEVRGTGRKRRGARSTTVTAPSEVEFRYLGLDGVTRITELRFEPPPDQLTPHRAAFDIGLEADARCSILTIVSCHEENKTAPVNFLMALRDIRRSLRSVRANSTAIISSNALFDEVIARSVSDLGMLITRTDLGPYPYAGIPWFSTVFGRDGIITAMLLLWMDPALARGVLLYLAATQARGFDAEADAQPGKILHERRHGEMARLGEVPFRQYYGSVDATPLFVMLAGLYFERTGDRDTLAAIWPNIEAALGWCDTYGDADGDGFVEYCRQTENGLANQGWKDSFDAIFHADGSPAEGPIALLEVQSYVFAAKRHAADLAAALGHSTLAACLLKEAAELKARFEEAYWCVEIGTYALALDGAKRPCRVRSSNAGHALFCGIAERQRALSVARGLMSHESFSGWGVRTVALGEVRYNPMSYHNGSVWPHDNALIGIGLARYGARAEAARLFAALFDAATYQDLHRLPELFCGFIRRARRGPTAYPVACSPQAWAAAAPFGLLGACLGLRMIARKNEIRFTDPVLPDFLDEVTLSGLCLGASRVDVRFHRHGRDVTVNVLSRQGDARVVLSK
jgi:glycogen debranching enzyme